ncbi:hypothetical protein B0O99DRAFT_594513 [Bisporella sp. PMI_857]|nr:hypothetical protein B0O99DRAFT_594513 [Bisporella sp. PMI_857]
MLAQDAYVLLPPMMNLLTYYAFLDYAIVHWVDHLEDSISYLATLWSVAGSGIGISVLDFYKASGVSDAGDQDNPNELQERCEVIEDSSFCQNLYLLLRSTTREIWNKQESLAAAGELGVIIEKNRGLLEALKVSDAFKAEDRKALEQYYGLHWNKCLHHACHYFHEGFRDAPTRDSHTNHHKKPFCCTELACSRLHIGFGMEQDLKKHMSIYHPNAAVFAGKSSISKIPAPKHICDVCSLDYARAHSLKAHKRTHVETEIDSISLGGEDL